ncbi:MAG: DUF4340 domain-containing protein [Thermoanaerobaculales bacterium]|nr:DUF4340 domain-containing protein [Thermoanaerobaculales bacterium]
MKSRNLIILAVVVIAVGAYIMLFERHRPTSDEATKAAEKVLRDFERDDVVGIVIDRADARVRLEKHGEQWRLREPLDFPADASVVSSTLGSLANLTADRRLSTDEVDAADYGLEEPAAEITLKMSDGNERLVVVGDEMPLGSKRALRVDGGDEVMIASGWFVSDLEREVDDWRSREVAEILENDVASIDIEYGADSIRAVRLEDKWQLLRPLEDMADGDHLGNVISDLASMRIEEFLDDDTDSEELGLELPEYEITIIRTDGGPPLRLDLGATREGDGGTEVACRRGDGEYFWASDRVRTRLSKAPVLWRSKKVMPFETWDVEELRVTTPESSSSLIFDDGFWVFADEVEANLTMVQERLRAIAELEATDYDLMAPLTREMGTVEVVFEAENDDGEQPVLTFSFYAPLEEGGRAMVQVTGRSTVMGVEAEDVEAILGSLDDLRPEPPAESDTDSE